MWLLNSLAPLQIKTEKLASFHDTKIPWQENFSEDWTQKEYKKFLVLGVVFKFFKVIS